MQGNVFESLVKGGENMSKQENCNIGFIESCDVPSVYSNKQSYYEVLCYINYKLNELIDVYNKLEFDYKSYVDSQLQGVKDYADEKDTLHSKEDRLYTDEKATEALTSSKTYADKLDRAMSNRVDAIDARVKTNETNITDLRNDLTQETIAREGADKLIDQKIIALETMATTRLAQLKEYVDKADLATKNWFNSELILMKQWVEEHYQKTYTIKNPWRGYKTDLQSCIDDIFSVYRPLSMSCSQLDNIIPEVTYIDSENLSCNDFDFNGLRVKQYLSDAYMHSPVSGRYLKLQDVIAEIMTQVVVSISTSSTNTGNRGYSKAFIGNNINYLESKLLDTAKIESLDERLALLQPYTNILALDTYPHAVLEGKNIITTTNSVLRYESSFN